MNKLTIRNLNPRNENIGDCVVRSFSAYFEDELNYDSVKEEILKYGHSKTDYAKTYVFDKFAKEANMVRIDVGGRTKNEVKTFNRAIEFAEQFKISMVAISNTHAGYIDYKSGLVDTWDSRGKHMKYFYIHRDDAKLLGLEIMENKKSSFANRIDYTSTWIAKEGSKYSIKSKA